MKKIILSAAAGYVTWSLLWLSLNAGILALFPAVDATFKETNHVDHFGYLMLLLVASVLCS